MWATLDLKRQSLSEAEWGSLMWNRGVLPFFLAGCLVGCRSNSATSRSASLTALDAGTMLIDAPVIVSDSALMAAEYQDAGTFDNLPGRRIEALPEPPEEIRSTTTVVKSWAAKSFAVALVTVTSDLPALFPGPPYAGTTTFYSVDEVLWGDPPATVTRMNYRHQPALKVNTRYAAFFLQSSLGATILFAPQLLDDDNVTIDGVTFSLREIRDIVSASPTHGGLQ
jgi:hypothetical protein